MRKLNLSKFERAIEDFLKSRATEEHSNLKCNFALIPTVFIEKIVENRRSIYSNKENVFIQTMVENTPFPNHLFFKATFFAYLFI